MTLNRIKEIRILKGLSINELADKAGVSKSYLSYIERGIQSNPSLFILSKIANSLDTTVEELLLDTNMETVKKEKKMDDEWNQLLIEMIQHGMTKEEFSLYLDYFRYKKYKKLE